MTDTRHSDPPGSAGAYVALERRAARQGRLVAILAATTLLAAGVAVYEDRRANTLTDLLEDAFQERACADRIEVSYDVALGDLVLGLVGRSAGDELDEFADAVDDLRAIDELCPPVIVSKEAP